MKIYNVNQRCLYNQMKARRLINRLQILGADTPRKRGAGYFGYRWDGKIYGLLVLFKICAN